MNKGIIFSSLVLLGAYLAFVGEAASLKHVSREAKLSDTSTVCTRTRVTGSLGCACFLEYTLPSFTDPDLSILCMAMFDEKPKDLGLFCTRFTQDGNIRLHEALSEFDYIRTKCDVKNLFVDDPNSVASIGRNEVSDEELIEIFGIERFYNDDGELVISEETSRFFKKIGRSIKKAVSSVVSFVKKPIEKVVSVVKDIIKDPVGSIIDYGGDIIRKAHDILWPDPPYGPGTVYGYHPYRQVVLEPMMREASSTDIVSESSIAEIFIKVLDGAVADVEGVMNATDVLPMPKDILACECN